VAEDNRRFVDAVLWIDRHRYRERNVCERFWSKAKQYRRVATRYEKKAANFLGFVKVAAIMVMLK